MKPKHMRYIGGIVAVMIVFLMFQNCAKKGSTETSSQQSNLGSTQTLSAPGFPSIYSQNLNVSIPASDAYGSIDLPANASDDGTITSYSWKQISGPTAATLINSNQSVVKISQLSVGNYQISVTAIDNDGNSGVGVFGLNVTKATTSTVSNMIIYAGADRTIEPPDSTGMVTSPDASFGFQASVTNAVGNVTYQWSQLNLAAAPSQLNFVFAIPTNPMLTVRNFKYGTYDLQVEATDSTGKSVKDQVQLIMKQPPYTVDAGADKNFNVTDSNSLVSNPSASVSFQASVSGTTGPFTYQWTQLNQNTAPSVLNFVFAIPGNPNLTVRNFKHGLYYLEVEVTDGQGVKVKDRVFMRLNK